MKKYRIIILFIIIGCIYWIIDSIVDYLIFHTTEGNFLDIMIINIDPHELWVRSFIMFFCLLAGVLISMFIHKRDIAREKLRKSEERLSTILNKSPIPTVVGGLNGSIASFNKALEQLTGYNQEEIIDVNDWACKLYPDKEYREFVQVNINQALERKKQEQDEFTITCKDGSTKIVSFKTSFYSDGLIIQMVDVTKQNHVKEALRKSEAKYRNIIYTMISGFALFEIIYEKDGIDARYIDANPAHEKLTGLKTAEIIGKKVSKCIPGLEETWLNNYAQVEKTGEPMLIEDYVKELNRWYKVLAYKPKPGFVAVTFEDITEQKKAEDKIIESEKKYRVLYHNSPDMYVSVSPHDTTINQCNETLLSNTGYSREEVVGSPVFKMYHNDSIAEAKKAFQEFVKTGIVKDRELILKRKDGSKIDVSLNVDVVRNQAGEIQYSISSWRDITERKQIEMALRESEKKYRFLAESIKDVVWMVDIKSLKFTYVSSSSIELSGFTPEETIGTDIQGVLTKDSRIEMSTALNEEIAKHQKGDINAGNRHLELQQYHKNGRIIWVSITTKFLKDENGDIISIIGTTRDITQRKQMEDNLVRWDKLESVGLLAGGIAHDFNNLLTGIMGNTSVALLKQGDFEKQEEILKKVVDASEKATNLTQQLLTFAKGGISVIKTASIAKIIKNTVDISLGQSSQAQCEMIFPEDLWLCDVDINQIGQIFQNLIINANQAMPEGGVIKIRTENVKLESKNPYYLEEGDFVCVSVKDNGIGIPTKYLSKIFDPYFSTKDQKKEQGGSGLGLAVSYSICQKHKGHICVISEEGEGSTFYVYLPANKCAVLEKIEDELIENTKKLKILVMDDDQVVLETIERILKHFGHQVILSENGKEAIEKYLLSSKSDNPFDLVILDLTIPGGMGGIETLGNLKEIDPNIKAIVSSGYSDKFPKGFLGILPKPYKIENLTKVLKEIMEK